MGVFWASQYAFVPTTVKVLPSRVNFWPEVRTKLAEIDSSEPLGQSFDERTYPLQPVGLEPPLVVVVL